MSAWKDSAVGDIMSRESKLLRLSDAQNLGLGPSFTFETIERRGSESGGIVQWQLGRYCEPANNSAFFGFNSKTVSRRHAEISFDNESNKYFIKDLGSSSGTFLNNFRLSSFKATSNPFKLNHGDILQLGQNLADDSSDLQSLCVRIRVELKDDSFSQADNTTVVPEDCASTKAGSADAIVPYPSLSPPSTTSHSPYRLPNDRLNEYFSTDKRRYSQVDIDRISRLLEFGGKPAYSRIPRIYIVLRLINRLEDIDRFLTAKVSDISFPFSASSLPTFLKPGTVGKFQEAQTVVLTKALDLEKHDGEHVLFEPGERLPFEVRGVLGSGAYGLVEKVISLLSHEMYARKSIRRKRNFRDESMSLAHIKKELAALKRVSHIHCVKLIGSYTCSDHIGLIMAPVCECDMSRYLGLALNDADRLSLLRTFFGCLATALTYLHYNQKIRHRDIKPQNILINRDCVLLTDFNISHDWSEFTHSTTKSNLGYTPAYAAPEVVSPGMDHNSSSDIWSLGCVFLEMLTVLKGYDVKKMKEHFREKHDDIKFHNNIAQASEWMEILEARSERDNITIPWIRSMLSHDKDSRPTAPALVEDIITSSRYDENRYHQDVFCGTCCLTDEDMTSSDDRLTIVVDDIEGTENDSVGWGKLSRGLGSSNSTNSTFVHGLGEVGQGTGSSTDADTLLNTECEPAERSEFESPALTTRSEVLATGLENDEPKTPKEAAAQKIPRIGKSVNLSRNIFSDITTMAVIPYNLRNSLAVLLMHCPFTAQEEARHLLLQILFYYHSSFDLCPLLLWAVSSQHLTFLELLLREAVATSFTLAKDTTDIELLHIAARNGDRKMIECLLNHGLNVNARDSASRTPLFWAAAYGYTSSVALLLTRRADISIKDSFGSTALTESARFGHQDTVSYICDFLGPSHLYWFKFCASFATERIQETYDSMISLVLDVLEQSSLQFGGFGSWWLQTAIENGDLVLMNAILKNMTVDINCRIRNPVGKKQPWKPNWTFLHCAISSNQFWAVQLLLLYGADVNTKLDGGRSSLFEAFSKGSKAIMLCLLENGAHLTVDHFPIRSVGVKCVSEQHMECELALYNSGIQKGLHTEIYNSKGETFLHQAAVDGHLLVVEGLLKGGLAVDAVDRLGRMPLHYAALNGHVEVVEQLLFSGAPVNALDCTNDAAAHLAAANDQPLVLGILHFRSASFSLTNDKDRTPLGCAIEGNCSAAVTFLLELGVDLRAADRRGWEPVHLAAAKGHDKILEILRKNGADLCSRTNDVDRLSVLHCAIDSDSESIFEYLLKIPDVVSIINAPTKLGERPMDYAASRGFLGPLKKLYAKSQELGTIAKYGKASLYLAAREGRVAVVNFLLDAGYKLNDDIGSGLGTPLHGASSWGQSAVIKLLLERGANVNSLSIFMHASPLHMACKDGRNDAVNLLLSNHADIKALTRDKETALHWAAMWDHPRVSDHAQYEESHHNRCINTLLAHGFDIHARSSDGYTPLFIAAKEGKYDNVSFLADCGSLVNTQDWKGTSPLHFAARHDDRVLGSLLLSLGALVNSTTASKSTPLHTAARHGKYPFCTLLLEKKASVYVKNSQGQTALHIAALQGHSDIVSLLLNKGAAVAAKNMKGQTARDNALAKGHAGIAKLLKEAAKPARSVNRSSS